MKHSEVHKKIVETASQLFYKNGYNSTGVNEIIATAEIAKATLYNHFKAKEDICVAYIEHKNSVFLVELEKYCKSKPQGREQVSAIFDFLLEFYNTDEFNGCWCIKTMAEIPIHDEKIRNEIQRQKNLFIQFIIELVKDNLDYDSEKEVKSRARYIYLAYESAVSESHLHQSDWPITESRNMCLAIIK